MADKPKRPLSAYMLWLGAHREQIKRENPHFKVTEIAKRGGELWRGLENKKVGIYIFHLDIFDRNSLNYLLSVCWFFWALTKHRTNTNFFVYYLPKF